MEKIYPFKFLDSYNKDDASIFFGRDEEVDVLYKMVFQTNLMLVYGASGSGKTSLVMCGLASRFQSHDWLALNIRRGSDINLSLNKILTEKAGSSQTDDNLDWLEDLNTDVSAKKTIAETPLQQSFRAIYLNYFRPIYLIFDQFEELYILGNKDEQEQFVQTVKTILELELPVKIIISIREEYLGHLYEFEKTVPQLLRKKLRVEAMNLDKVRQVISGVADYKNSNVTVNENEKSEIATNIFDRIKEKGKLNIQLPYLQVYLDKLYVHITHDESRKDEAVITLGSVEEIGDINDVLSDFLEEQVKKISRKLSAPSEIAAEETIWKILSPFATVEGTKEPISKEDLLHRLPKNIHAYVDGCLKELLASRILRYSEYGDLYEVAHDTLAVKIAEKRTGAEVALEEVRLEIKKQVALKENARELFTEKQMTRFEPYLDILKEGYTAEEERWVEISRNSILLEKQKKKVRTRLTYAVITIVLIVMTCLSAWALIQQQKATEAYDGIKKEQAISKAKVLEAFGLSYRDLGKTELANSSFQSALEILKDYPEDPLYKQISKDIRK